MVFKFTIISDEVDDFVRKIEIDSEASFLDLHNIILDSVKYTKDQITSFFLCNDDWEKEQEITLIEMDTDSEYDNLTMDGTKLYELLDDEKQKMIFVFDMISDRAFFMELTEIILNKDLNKAKITKSEGDAPIQFIEDEIIESFVTKTLQTSIENTDNYFDDNEDNYDEEDLDNIDLDNLNIDEDFY